MAQRPSVGNLPPETTSFVGRERELAEVKRLFHHFPLVTLTGLGGVGKTRVALRAARELHGEFADGVWLVELSSLRTPALLSHTIAQTLAIADQTTRPLPDVLTDFLAARELLLVLDTCEHLVGACAHLVSHLCRSAPWLCVLATSRQPLDIIEEQQVEILPLPVPEDPPAPQQPPQTSQSSQPEGHVPHGDEALRLFAERAAAVLPGFVITPHNRRTVTQVCRHLEGIPLAIELAAARLRDAIPEEKPEEKKAFPEGEDRPYAGALGWLAGHLDNRLGLLVHDRVHGTVALRHQALRTTIGWSHELCAPLERLLWARLSVFAGSFKAEAAQQVCCGGPLLAQQIPPILHRLVDKSILVQQESPAGPGFRTVRYRMLDTVREYGGQWLGELGEQEERETQRRHRNHYLHLARQGDAQWMGPDQVAWYERMVAEHANLRAALDFSLAEPDGRTALELAAALWFFWLGSSFQREGRRYMEQALAAAPQSSPARIQALWACGVAAAVQGDTEAGLRLGTACHQVAQEQDDPDAALAATHLIGMSLALRGELARAAILLDQAPPAPGRRSGYKEASRLLSQLWRAFVRIQVGEFAQGATLADEVRVECSRRGEQWVRAFADVTRAMADLGRGDAVSAAVYARASLEGKRALHDTFGMGLALDLLVSAAVAEGEGERAARLLGLGQQLWQIVGRPQYGSSALLAAREACERQVRKAIGDAAYEAAYKAGLEMDPDDGIAYALTAPPRDA